LGLGDRVVGRTRWCDYPAAAGGVPSVGDGLAPNVEAITARHPNLVVAYRSASNAAAIRRLRDLGIPVIELALDRLADLERAARVLAAAAGRPALGDTLIASVKAEVKAATRIPGTRPSVFVLTWRDPPITLGAGSFLSEVIHMAGGANLFADRPEPSFVVSIEAVARRAPDWVLVVGEDEPAFAGRPEWQTVGAIRDRRFLRVNGSMFNRPSPRIGEAIRQLAASFGSGGGH
jgi:ABC-type Fe3+-hydroxamate transport system substrate-binding protein